MIRHLSDHPVIERVTNAARVITSDHGAIHAGEGFASWHQFDSVANDAVRYVLFKASVEKYVHLKVYEVWISNAKGVLDIYEAPDAATGDVAFTPSKRSRVSAIASSVVLHTGATAVTVGAANHVDQIVFGGGGVNVSSRAGGNRSLDMELVFDPGTEYLFRLTNNSGVDADMWLWLFWYEEAKG